MKFAVKIFLLLLSGFAITSCSKYEFAEPISGSKSVVSVRENANSASSFDLDKVTVEESLIILNSEGIKQVR
jgi:hypothetical protein